MIAEAERQGGGGAMYGRFLVEELKPFIDRTYRTRPGREHTGVGGSSLGGLISMYLGLQYPEVYSKLLVVSPSVWWDEEVIVEDVEKMQQKPDQKIWLDMGTGEGESMVSGAEHLYEALTAKGFVPDQDLKFVLDEGAEHNETAWAGRVEEMLRFLFPAHP
jgi:predicted alpha/beta superfamily hydrolase